MCFKATCSTCRMSPTPWITSLKLISAYGLNVLHHRQACLVRVRQPRSKRHGLHPRVRLVHLRAEGGTAGQAVPSKCQTSVLIGRLSEITFVPECPAFALASQRISSGQSTRYGFSVWDKGTRLTSFSWLGNTETVFGFELVLPTSPTPCKIGQETLFPPFKGVILAQIHVLLLT